MLCPYCQTENRDERTACYNCEGDLGPLRSVIAKSRQAYNDALVHIERKRNREAIEALRAALDLDASFVNAWVVLGTVHAREEQFGEAEAAWKKALALDPRFEKCHTYIMQTRMIAPALPALRRAQRSCVGLAAVAILLAIALFASVLPGGIVGSLDRAGETARTLRGNGLIILLLLAPVILGAIVGVYLKMPAIAETLSRIYRDRR